MLKFSKVPFVAAMIVLLTSLALPVAADTQTAITYRSQPDEVAIFLNNIAFVRDSFILPSGSDVEVLLPPQSIPNTVILRENGERVPTYRLIQSAEQARLVWESQSDAPQSEVVLEYLLTGLSWSALYDMTLFSDDPSQVALYFLAEVQNQVLSSEEVKVTLVNGRVDTNQALGAVSTITANQVIVGYDEAASVPPQPTGTVTIQSVYELGNLPLTAGETLYSQLTEGTFPARRILIWNAASDLQATVIYKVRNESPIPFAEGITRSYENGLFIGSDFIELTPVGGEGSVTVGGLQNVRVSRSESQSLIENAGEFDPKIQHEVTLTLSNFSDQALEVEVVDQWIQDASDFKFSLEAQFDANNILRWMVTLPPSETLIIDYQFKTYY